MSKRNMKQTASKLCNVDTIKKNKYLTAYSMDIEEITDLLEISKADAYKAISIAFNYGFVLGTRAKARDRVPVL